MRKLNRSAFTIIELVFVIAILGITMSIGLDIIMKVYGQYIVQRANHRLSIKTQIALNQITNRIRYAVPYTIVRRDSLIGGTVETLEQPMAQKSDTYTILQWVGTDMDSFETIGGSDRRPGWSGFTDIKNSTANNIVTPGSNLDLINPIISNLSNGSKTISDAVLYFDGDDNNTAYNISSINSASNTIIMNTPIPRISERYKLAWASYAISVENNDLFLYYNFAPVVGTDITGARRELLLKHVVNFKFKQEGGVTRIKLCVKEKIDDTEFISLCQERAIF